MNELSVQGPRLPEPVEPDTQATPDEVERRVEKVWEWLCQPMPRHRVVRRAIDEWGVARRTARWYMQRSRARFVPELSDADAEDKRAEAIAQCERNLADLAVQAARVKALIEKHADTKKPRDWMYSQLTRISSESARWLKLKAELEGILTSAAPIIIAGEGLNEALEEVRRARALVEQEINRPVDVEFTLLPSPEADDGGHNGSGR